MRFFEREKQKGDCMSTIKHENMAQMVSVATKQNWNRLNVSNFDDRLISRANKKLSSKRIIPVEYFSNPSNVKPLLELLSFVKEKNFAAKDVLFSMALQILKKRKIFNAKKSSLQRVLSEYPYLKIDAIDDFALPDDEHDLLGLFYQCLKTEGGKNIEGSYYTPAFIAEKLLSEIKFDDDETYLDPSCGSSNLLLTVKGAKPHQLFGIDIDPIAVMISKFNLIIKYADYDFYPQIFCLDFLNPVSLFSYENILNGNLKFDYIITNPPWGAIDEGKESFKEIASKESYSRFIIQAVDYLKEGGLLRYLLPRAFLNVKTHSDIRKFIAVNYSIEKITFYPNSFSGVFTKFIDVSIRKSPPQKSFLFESDGNIIKTKMPSHKTNAGFIFSILNDMDLQLLNLIYDRDYLTLKDSVWALGIVTGNNKEKLSDFYKDGYEKIWTGKEIKPYKLEPNKKFILYDRTKFQQAARDEIYRSPQKLVYKFISDKLIFAFDCEKRLFLNSANILIPKIKGMSIKSVLLFLNSQLFQFVYKKKFEDIKILRGNLSELPFAQISSEQDKMFAALADEILDGNSSAQMKAQDEIYDLYGIDRERQKYMKEILWNS
jgi:methylase of polypeptide subunit release factors